jgi:hypothetical protein
MPVARGDDDGDEPHECEQGDDVGDDGDDHTRLEFTVADTLQCRDAS